MKICVTEDGWQSSYAKEEFHKTVYPKKLPEYLICQIAWKYQDWLTRLFVTKSYKFTSYQVSLRGWNILNILKSV